MTKTQEGTFLSEADNLEISVLCIMPSEDIEQRGIIQLVHGMSEHKERYIPFMNYMAEKGYITVIHDHRGHGRSVEEEKDLGYMYGGGAAAMLGDIMTVNCEIRRHFPKLPLILFGHSMGSLAVRAFASAYDECMDMLIVCGSPSKNAARPVGKMIAAVEGRILGSRHKSKLLEMLSFGSYVWKFRGENNRNAWICSDPEVYRKYDESKLCGFTFTDDAYIALFDLMKKTYDIRRWNCKHPDVPVLFISGAQDPCLGNVRKFANAVQDMRRAGYRDVKGKLYPDMRHEILNEKGKEDVWKDIALYIRKKGF